MLLLLWSYLSSLIRSYIPKFLQVLFEYLEKKRKTFFRERGGCGRKAYSKELLPFTEKYPLVLPQGKLVFAGCQNPPLLPLLGNIQKGQVTSLSSLLLSLLQKLLFVNPFFDTPIPSYCYLYFPTFSPNRVTEKAYPSGKRQPSFHSTHNLKIEKKEIIYNHAC